MPIYSYVCPNCQHETEIMKNVSKCYETEYCTECNEVLERAKGDFCKAYINCDGFYGKVSN